MKLKFLLLFLILLNISSSYSQEEELNVRIKALDIGEYQYSKVKKNTIKALYGAEALKALEKRIEGNQKLSDFIGGTMLEQDIVSYYPQEDIVLFECPVRSIRVFDLKNISDSYGDPATYAYSPSGKYRFSTLEADGIHYYLEEKINEKYVYLGRVFPPYLTEKLSGFYWHDDKTLHYLKECNKTDGSTYWRAYSVKFTF